MYKHEIVELFFSHLRLHFLLIWCCIRYDIKNCHIYIPLYLRHFEKNTYARKTTREGGVRMWGFH